MHRVFDFQVKFAILMPMLKSLLEKKLKRIVQDLMPLSPDKIVLFGSAGKPKQMDEYSDIDIAVILETNLHFLERLKKVGQLCSLSDPIDFLVYTPEEFKRMRESGNPFAVAIQQGRLLYEKKPRTSRKVA